MTEAHLDRTEEEIRLCSGNPEDMVPFLVVRRFEGKIVFHIPGGGSLELDPEIARQFIQNITGIIEEAEFNQKVEGGYFDWYVEEV